MGGMSSPSFHTLGIYTQLLHPIYCLACVAVYPPTVFSSTDLPLIPSADNVLDHLRRTHCEALVTIPATLQVWSHSQEAIDFLKTFVFVVSLVLFKQCSESNAYILGLFWRSVGREIGQLPRRSRS
jgi:hypothetical protein